MRVAVLGLGVIGTTYAYTLQQAGHDTFHIVREGKKVPSKVSVHLLDGRYNSKGEEKDGEYSVNLAGRDEEYDFILISIASGKLEDAMNTLRDRNLKGTVILFSNEQATTTGLMAFISTSESIILPNLHSLNTRPSAMYITGSSSLDFVPAGR